MRIDFLGTGASEGIPGAFCSCAVCSEARAKPGRGVRRRSSVLIDDKLIIDLSPDFWAQSLMLKNNPSELRYILITHDHAEHFYTAELHNLAKPYRLDENPAKLKLYAPKLVIDRLNLHIREQSRHDDASALVDAEQLDTFKPHVIGEYTITPLLARHCKDAYIYLIESNDKTILYCCDSGFFPEETWDFLKGKPLNFICLDCNNPFNSDTPNHMSIEDVVTTRRRLFVLGCVTNNTRVAISHISHNAGIGHDAMQERLNIYGVTVAYDGWSVEV